MAIASGVIEVERGSTLVLSRVFDAPRELVFDAWTQPEHVAQWWGPAGFENTRVDIDLRVGGEFRVFMRAPDASVHVCTGAFIEIARPARLVYEGETVEGHPCGAGIPPYARVSVAFEEAAGGKTKLTITTEFRSPEARLAAKAARFDTSWLEGLERLAESLR